MHSYPQHDPRNSLPWEASTNIFYSLNMTQWCGYTQPQFWEALNPWLNRECLFWLLLEITSSGQFLFQPFLITLSKSTPASYLSCYTSSLSVGEALFSFSYFILLKMTTHPQTGRIGGHFRCIEPNTIPCLSPLDLMICLPPSVSWAADYRSKTTPITLLFHVLKQVTQSFGCICSIAGKNQHKTLLEPPITALTFLLSGEPCGWCVGPALLTSTFIP